VNPGSIARRYARALYELAVEDGVVEAIHDQLAAFSEAMGALSPDALAPGALPADSRHALGEKLASRFGEGSLFSRFVRVLAAGDRLGEVPRIAEQFLKMKDDAEGRARARVVLADALTSEGLKSLARVFSQITGKQVVPEVELDAALIGGVIVELEGRVYDGSLRSALRQLGERMSGGSRKSAA
jgi:F-type H+-transporting ATPase subunit delta